MKQLNLFIVTDKHKYKRAYVIVVSVADHEIVVIIDGKNYIILSDYKIPDMIIDDVIFGFVYKKENDDYMKAYPLPDNVSNFDESAVTVTYPMMGDAALKEAVYEDNGITSLKENLSQIQKEIRNTYQIRNTVAFSQVNFARLIPVSKKAQVNQVSGSQESSRPNIDPSPDYSGSDKKKKKDPRHVKKFLKGFFQTD